MHTTKYQYMKDYDNKGVPVGLLLLLFLQQLHSVAFFSPAIERVILHNLLGLGTLILVFF